MQIIAGKYRGMVLASFAGKDVRPTLGRVRESLFQILEPKLRGARVLDLFCGSGALGIESISRGAEEVCFNDISKESIQLLQKNLKRIQESYFVTCLDFASCLSRAEGQFDLIFSDPPYREEYLSRILSLVGERNLLRAGGLLLHESGREEQIPAGWTLKRLKRYAKTYVHFLEREP